MPKLDRLIQELTTQRQLFFLSIAVIMGILGYLASNLGEWPLWLGSVGVGCVLVAVLFGLSRYTRMKELLEEIEDCE